MAITYWIKFSLLVQGTSDRVSVHQSGYIYQKSDIWFVCSSTISFWSQHWVSFWRIVLVGVHGSVWFCMYTCIHIYIYIYQSYLNSCLLQVCCYWKLMITIKCNYIKSECLTHTHVISRSSIYIVYTVNFYCSYRTCHSTDIHRLYLMMWNIPSPIPHWCCWIFPFPWISLRSEAGCVAAPECCWCDQLLEMQQAGSNRRWE